MMISADALQELLDTALARHGVPGASVAIIDKGELRAAAAGVTNITSNVEVTRDTVMHIGSITKVFNATLVMQLVDDGAIGLNERVSRYLPELRLKDRGALEQITVEMLLNHTSGIDGETLPDRGHDEETIAGVIRRFSDLGQVHRPGAEFSYCNAGSVIAGYLVQRLRGKSWYDLIRERIFEPLKMKQSATLPEEALLHRASVGHYRDPVSGKVARTSRAFLPLSFAPCGTTLMMSASDLITFARAHLSFGVGPDGTRILSEQSTRAMQKMTLNREGRGFTSDGAAGIGLGWMVFKNGLLHHSGGGPGVVSVLYAHPERDFAVAILTNAEHGFDLINEVLAPWFEALMGTKPIGMAEVKKPAEPIHVEPANYAGLYEDVCVRYRVTQTSDGLALSRQWKFAYYDSTSTEATEPAPLIPLGQEKFLLEPATAADQSPAAFRVYSFKNPDEQGRMQHLAYAARVYPRSSGNAGDEV